MGRNMVTCLWRGWTLQSDSGQKIDKKIITRLHVMWLHITTRCIRKEEFVWVDVAKQKRIVFMWMLIYSGHFHFSELPSITLHKWK